MTQPRPSALAYWGALAGCALLVVGALGTWKVADTFGSTATATGVEYGADGPVIIAFAVVAAAMLVCLRAVPQLPIWAAVVALVAGGLALLTSIADTIDIASRRFLSPGWGIWLDLAAAGGLVAACVALLVRSVRHQRTLPPAVWAQAASGTVPPPPSPPPAPGATPPGWHPDPWGQGRLRFWDGSGWTGHTAD